MTDELEWMDDALCRGVNARLFYPGQGETDVVNEAKAVCAECPVKDACLEYALANGEKFGIWGGLSERERRAIRRARWRELHQATVSPAAPTDDPLVGRVAQVMDSIPRTVAETAALLDETYHDVHVALLRAYRSGLIDRRRPATTGAPRPFVYLAARRAAA